MLAARPGVRIVNLDLLTYAGNLQNLADVQDDPRYAFVRGDICDTGLVRDLMDAHAIDTVVNFAAESHVDRSILDPGPFARTNILGVMSLLRAADEVWGRQDHQDKVFVQVSTDEVYGSLGPEGFFTEKTPMNPRNPYAASKASADMMVMAWYNTYGLPVRITRCSNNYGPKQFPEKLIPLMIHNCLERKPLPVYGDGLHVRDWLYVDDHCRALEGVLDRGVNGEVYNIGGHNERTNIDVVRAIITWFSQHADPAISEELITYVDDRKGHDRRYAMDASKIREELGWLPAIPFEEGLASTIAWYVRNPQWVRGVISGEYRQYYERRYGQ